MTIQETLRQALIDRGISTRAVSMGTGCNRATVLKFKNGDTVSGVTVDKLAAYLDFELVDGLPTRQRHQRRNLFENARMRKVFHALSWAIDRTTLEDWREIAKDIIRTGAREGLPNFTLYVKKNKIYNKHRAVLCELVLSEAEHFDKTAHQIVAGEHYGMPQTLPFSPAELNRVLMALPDAESELEDIIKGHIVWYVVEAAARGGYRIPG